MKQLVCEMCGDTNFVKQDGLFVCQGCGCKYSPEEAKKMMGANENNSKTPNSTPAGNGNSFIDKCLANAHRAKQKEDWEEVEKYYNMVEQNDPDNIEAIFYSSYGKVMSSMTDSDFYKREATCNVLMNSLSLISENYCRESISLVEQISKDIFTLTKTSFVYIKKDEGLMEKVFKKLHSEWIHTLHDITLKTSDTEELNILHRLVIAHYRKADKSSKKHFDVSHKWFLKNDQNYRKEDENAKVIKEIEALASNVRRAKGAYEESRNSAIPGLLLGFLGVLLLIVSLIANIPIMAFLGFFGCLFLIWGLVNLVKSGPQREEYHSLLNKYNDLVAKAKKDGIKHEFETFSSEETFPSK